MTTMVEPVEGTHNTGYSFRMYVKHVSEGHCIEKDIHSSSTINLPYVHTGGTINHYIDLPIDFWPQININHHFPVIDILMHRNMPEIEAISGEN